MIPKNHPVVVEPLKNKFTTPSHPRRSATHRRYWRTEEQSGDERARGLGLGCELRTREPKDLVCGLVLDGGCEGRWRSKPPVRRPMWGRWVRSLNRG